MGSYREVFFPKDNMSNTDISPGGGTLDPGRSLPPGEFDLPPVGNKLGEKLAVPEYGCSSVGDDEPVNEWPPEPIRDSEVI